MWVTSHQEDKLDKLTWENCGWVTEKKENLKRWKVPERSKRIYSLEKSFFQTARRKIGSSSTEKNNEPNQKLTEIDV